MSTDRQILTNARVFDGERFHEERAVVIEDGVIRELISSADAPVGEDVIDLGGHILAAGFIDVQTNGGGGVLFNAQPTQSGIAEIARAHRRFGTTGFLPTLISDGLDTMKEAATAVSSALAENVPGVLGIHFEGPYLNVARKGVHDPDRIREFEADALELFKRRDLGRVLVTLAPEKAPPGLIGELAEAGVIVSAGHTAATYDEANSGFGQGITGVTHLFNAMPPLESRAPGIIAAALECADCWCSLIVDGHHVEPATARIALRAKAGGRMMLITDAMPTVGSANKSFELGGVVIHVEDGRCALADGTLAGSDLDMASAVRNTVNMLRLPLEEALRMASACPAEFLGMADRRGRIAPGLVADLVQLDANLAVQRTWIGGERADHDQE